MTVSSRLPPEPVNFPVFTSTTVIASVRSKIKRAAGGQPHLAVEALGDLLVDAVRREDVVARVVLVVALQALLEVRRDLLDVVLDHLPGVVTGDHELAEVLGEQVADDLQGQVRLAVQQLRGPAALVVALLDLGLDVAPAGGEPLDVAGQLVLGGSLGRRAHDDAGGVRDDLLEHVLEAGALGVGELAGDAAGVAVGHVDQEPARQADLAGEPGALVADRVLGDLHQDRLTRLEHLLDLAGAVAGAERVPVDLAGVEDRVAPLADVDERRLHRGQHVLHPAEVDVADQRASATPARRSARRAPCPRGPRSG